MFIYQKIYFCAMRYLLICLCFMFLLFACDNEVNLVEDRKDIPVVYGLLDPSDTAQYFRIERAFVDEEISAFEIAQRPDSLYYANAVARIIDIESEASYTFEKVDGNLEGYLRDQGVFAQAPNYLYKLSENDFIPEEGRRYRFELERGDQLSIVTSETTIIDNPTIVSPPATVPIEFKYTDQGVPALSLFSWKLTEAEIFDLIIEIKYTESVNGGPFEDIVLVWNFASNIRELEYEIDGAEFFNFIASRVSQDDGAIRVFKNLDFVIKSGGQEILDYVNIVNANLGITSSQDIPTYTNLSEGVGIFSSRNEIRRENIPITPITLDSLRNGIFTRHLNFQ